MTPERWQQVRDVLEQAIALDSAARSSYLEMACQNDPELRAEVDSLLRSHDQAGSVFLKKPAMDLIEPSSNEARPSPRVGRRIGSYQIAEEIGHGGMGEVYRATRADGQYKKDVAVKLVRVGLDSSFVLQRFLHERQILASLDHPHIARLLDGGTTEDGVPFLVMELIEGEPIDRYCDEHSLNITQRLKLFAQVCGAVQYAHQRLVIHRDIKPSNMLVTKEGEPKLLDFGIAKILDPSAGPEATLVGAMTPEYASPEQVRGEPITTATDVYSLGVVLYQLLTGRSPYPGDTTTPHELARAVCEFEPGRPSTVIAREDTRMNAQTADAISRTREGSPQKLRRRLAGDLDNIVLKAVRKEPERRYISVEQFAEDIRRHLEGLPVKARQDSWSYRAGKFVRRHKVGMAATALVLLAVAGGVAATIHQARIAEANRRRAEARFNDVRKLAHSLMFDIHDSVATLPGATPTLQLLIKDSQEYLDSLAKEASGDSSLQRELAMSYERLGNAQGNPFESNLGDPRAALQSYQKSLAIREQVARANPASGEDQAALAGSYRLIGLMYWAALGDSAKGWENIQKAIAIAEAAPEQSTNMRVVGELGMDYETRGVMQGGDGQTAGLGNPRAGMEDHKKALTYFVRLAAAYPNDPRKQRKIPMLNMRIGDELLKMGDRQDAIHQFQLGLDLMLRMPQDPNNRVIQRDLDTTYASLGDALLMEGRTAEAEKNFEKELATIQTVASADKTDTSTLLYLGSAYADVGRGLVEAGNPRKGIPFLRKAVAEGEHLQSLSNTNWDATTLAQLEVWLGEGLGAVGERSEERQLYRKALEIYSKVSAADAKDFQDAIDAAECKDRLAASSLRSGDLETARKEYSEALGLAQKVAPNVPESVDARYLLAATYSGLGDVAAARARAGDSKQGQSKGWNEARNWYQQSLEEWAKIPNPSHIAPNEFKVELPSVIEQRRAQSTSELDKQQNSIASK